MTTAAAQPTVTELNRHPMQKSFVVVSIMLATIMQALDTTIANVALPHMQGALSATQEQISWVLTSYIVSAAIMTAPTGILAARLGRRKLFLISVIGFTIASMLCGIAQTLPEMVVFRLLQGVFGAGLIPLSQAVLLDINPPEKHGQAMAMWGVGVMLGPILGPTLGGWLTEYYDWRWVFFINLPIGIIATVGMVMFMPETAKDNTRKFDLAGFIYLAMFVFGIQMMLDRGETLDWFSSNEIIIEGVIAIFGLYLFVVHLLTAKKPFFEPAMFADRNYSVALVFIFLIGIILLSTMALLPPYLQNLMGYPVITTGEVLAPRGVGTMLSMMLAGKLLARKVDVRYMIMAGLFLTAYSLYEMSLFNLEITEGILTRTGLIQGFGMGLVFVPLSTIAYATLPGRFRNDATSVFSLVRNIGSSIGIAVMIALASRFTQINHEELVGRLSPLGMPATMLQSLPTHIMNMQTTEGLAMLNSEVTRQSAAIAYLNDFRLMMYVVLAALPLLLLMRSPKKTKEPHVEQAVAALE